MTPEMTAQMEQELKRTEAIINSMTPDERDDHLIINGVAPQAHRRWAAATTVNDVNSLLKQYVEMKRMMRADDAAATGCSAAWAARSRAS